MNIPESALGNPDSRRNILDTALHQHHVSRIYRHISSCTNSYSKVCTSKRRCIIYAVANHCHNAVFHELPYHSFFAIWLNGCHNLVDSCLLSDSRRSNLVVASQHNRMDSQLLKLSNCLLRILFYHIRNAYDTEKLRSLSKKNWRLTFHCKTICKFLNL